MLASWLRTHKNQDAQKIQPIEIQIDGMVC
eukprot:SAG11_NODE_33091_length_279_cov_0.577778_1_plen_29_part_01